jgi:hypothetical protein
METRNTMLKQNCHLACSGPNGKGILPAAVLAHSAKKELESAAQSIGAFIKRLFISLSTRLPGSLLEMKILFEHRISCFHERSAEPQIPRLRSG